jgi:hypothetical protein
MRKLIRSPFLAPLVVAALAIEIIWVGLGNFQRSALEARKAVCEQEMYVFNSAVNQYTVDHQSPPKSAQDLIEGQYLVAIPPAFCVHESDSPPALGDPIPSLNFSAFHRVGVN